MGHHTVARGYLCYGQGNPSAGSTWLLAGGSCRSPEVTLRLSTALLRRHSVLPLRPTPLPRPDLRVPADGRTRGRFGLGGALKITSFHHPCHRQGHLSLE